MAGRASPRVASHGRTEMAWVLITGEDTGFYQGATERMRPVGYDVVAVPDGSTALQLLVDDAQPMVVLLRDSMGQMGVSDFLSAVADNDVLRRRHAYILLDGLPDDLPADVERYCAELAVPLVEVPADASDSDGWADLLDAIALAVRQLY